MGVVEGVSSSTYNEGKAIYINESGLYNLIFGSSMPAAKQFKKWVTADVLPSIRKTGGYEALKSELALKDKAHEEALALKAKELSETVALKDKQLADAENK